MPEFALKVEAGGTAISCNSVRVQYQMNQVPVAMLLLELSRDKSSVLKKTLEACVAGAEVIITLDKQPLFRGKLTRRICDYRSDVLSLSLEAVHEMQKLKINTRSALFSDKTDSQIMTQLFREQGISLQKVEGMNVKHKQMIQFNCSDWRFIRARLRACGSVLVPTPSGISIIPVAEPKSVMTITAGKDNVFRATAETDTGLVPEDITVGSWNIAEQAFQSTKAAAVTLGKEAMDSSHLAPFQKASWILGSGCAIENQEREESAKALRTASLINSLRALFTVTGSLKPVVGNGVKVEGFDSCLDGTGLITQIRHEFTVPGGSQEPWVTVIGIGNDMNAGLSGELIPAASGLQTGIVDKNEAPDENHAINIVLPVLRTTTPVKARLAVPMAGKESGFNFFPQPGDEVVVAFMEEDPRYPVILGAMHNPKNKAPVSELDKGIGIVLKTGDLTQRVLLHPEQGLILEEKKSSKSSRLILKDGGASLKVNADVTVEADQKATLSGRSGVEVKGSKVELKN